MKTTLEFNLPEEQTEMLHAVHASDAWCALSEIDQNLRSLVKYGTYDGYEVTTTEQLASEIRKRIGDVLAKIDS